MTQTTNKTATGRISLVGAGPGDPGLITLAGLERLRQAEVIVYDALANPELLEYAPIDAQRIDVGKRAGQQKLCQDEICRLLVDKAHAGKFVVRLKGGDPYLFGRGAEEASFAARHGVECEIIAGITAGIAAPMAAGIPVTHREFASSVTFVTGHEDPTKQGSAVDYDALARLIATGGTVCFYMGVGRLPEISQRLQDAGLPASTPAAAVQWGTLPRQRSVRATVKTLPRKAADAAIAAPAIIVVGQVAAIDEPGLDFFTRRPLFGKTVIITRTRQQASVLRRQLEQHGAEVIETPTIELVPPNHWDEMDQALRDIPSYDWLVLTSVNGVAAVEERLEALGVDSRHFSGVKIAAIGDATAEALKKRLNIEADLVPTRYVAESLAGELIQGEAITGKRCLLLRADIARPALPRLLEEAGAEVTEVTAYRTRLAGRLPEDALEALRDQRVDWVTFTSSSTAENLVTLLKDEADLLKHVRIASIGPITSETVRKLGYEVAVEADVSNIDGLVDALTAEETAEPEN
ncbi:MAG: uroporphyrinogen-III C-methyltransferase [Phycisphaeraceae bacterium]